MKALRRRLAAAFIATALLGALFAQVPSFRDFIGKAYAQGVIGIFQTGLPNQPSVYGAGDSTSGVYFGTGFAGFTKHLAAGSGGAVPTVATCGTGTVTAGSSDNAGAATATGATACTVTFGTAFTSQPFCSVVDNTTAAGLKLTYSTGASVTVTGLTSGDAFSWLCMGQKGG